MRDRDLDLIAALVEGRLDDETEARALIASGAEFQEEYEAQKLAYETLSGVGSAMLSDTERAALHRDVWTELRTTSSTSPARTSSPWYYRWAGVAAGMFVVVGLVAVLNQGGSGDDTGAEAFSATTAAATETADAATTDSTEAAGSDDEPQAAQDGGAAPADFLSGDFSRTLSADDIAFYEAQAQKVRSGNVGSGETLTIDEKTPATGVLQACVESADLSGFRALGTSSAPDETGAGSDTTVEGSSEDEPRYIVAVPEEATLEEEALEEAPIAFVDISSCELVFVDQ